MHENVLPGNCLELLKDIETSPAMDWSGWTLAGGTGLALRYGHRLSVDLDFFCTDAVPLVDLLHGLRRYGACEVLQDYEHTLTLLLREVKLSFFTVADPWIAAPADYRFFKIADILDIGLMKLAAVAGRGSRKDFIDLYFILHDRYTLDGLLSSMDLKYKAKKANQYHLLRSLAWFEDAEKEPMPRMLSPFEWEACKDYFVQEVRRITLYS